MLYEEAVASLKLVVGNVLKSLTARMLIFLPGLSSRVIKAVKNRIVVLTTE